MLKFSTSWIKNTVLTVFSYTTQHGDEKGSVGTTLPVSFIVSLDIIGGTRKGSSD